MEKMKRGISIYSFQEKYYEGKMSLEDCIATAASFGVKGIEMLPDQMVPGYPSVKYNLSETFANTFEELMNKYQTIPVCFDVYGETKLYKHRAVTQQEIVEQLVMYMKTAKRLGFPIMRLLFHIPVDVIEQVIPYAEELDVKLAIEVHAPHLITGDWVNRNLEMAQKQGTKHFGIMPDLGTFVKTLPRVLIADQLRKGAQQNVVDYIDQVYASQDIPKDLKGIVERMGGNTQDLWLANQVTLGRWKYHDPKLLLDYMPYIFHIHGKFYEVTEELVEPDVDYDNIMAALQEGGYTGYIMSEYEGQRITQGMDVGYDEVEQVRRHQEMLKAYLGE
jgi:sugar phosphate isomerase/epimerase